jgi:hypothetical protein
VVLDVAANAGAACNPIQTMAAMMPPINDALRIVIRSFPFDFSRKTAPAGCVGLAGAALRGSRGRSEAFPQLLD